MTEEQYLNRRQQLIKYLLMKVEQSNDWHACADASMDLRDLDEYWKGYSAGINTHQATESK